MKVAIIDYGAGNTQSVKYALNRIGCEGFLTSDEEEIKTSDKGYISWCRRRVVPWVNSNHLV